MAIHYRIFPRQTDFWHNLKLRRPLKRTKPFPVRFRMAWSRSVCLSWFVLGIWPSVRCSSILRIWVRWISIYKDLFQCHIGLSGKVKAILYYQSFGCSLGCSFSYSHHCDFPEKETPPSFQPPSASGCKATTTSGSLLRCVSHVISRDCQCQELNFVVELGRCEYCRLQFPCSDSRHWNPKNFTEIETFWLARRRVAAWC